MLLMYPRILSQGSEVSAAQMRGAQQGLSAAISKWESATGEALQAPKGLLEVSQDGSHPMHHLEHHVVRFEVDLKRSTASAKSAVR